MRCSCTRGGFGASSFDDDDGLAKRDLACSRKKGARVAHRFHVEQNALGVGIVAEVIDEISPAYVEHGAGGNNGAESHVFLLAPVEDGGLQRAALAKKCDAAFLRHCIGETGIEPD